MYPAQGNTISGTVSEAEVLASVCGNDDELFQWDLLTGPLNIETKSTLLQKFTQLWLIIRVHAFTKMVLEEHKHDKLPQPAQRHSGLLYS